MKKRITIFICAVLIAAGALAGLKTGAANAATSQVSEVRTVADSIIAWKKTDVGSDGYLLNDVFLEQAGTTPGDWYPIGLGRLGVKDNQQGYLGVVGDEVQKRYQTEEKLDRAKATEWHRISLAVLSSGGNPRRMGNGGTIDLIADGTYNRVDINGNGILGRQGINGFIWGLIALDSRFYEVPDGAYYSRDDMILNILNRQLADGGWALSGSASDPDMTAMAMQALAPYYNSEKAYAFVNKKLSPDGAPVTKKVRAAVDEALVFLSKVQQNDGGFVSWGMPNCESAVQAAVALCSLGVDLFSDARFIKSGKTVYDGILKFRNGDGGFLHSFVYDDENPSSLPDQSNTMASEQALYGMAAILRAQNGCRRLYDFRNEDDAYWRPLKAQIAAVETAVGALTYSSALSEMQNVYKAYLAIEASERSYVKNYSVLSELLAFAGIPYAEEKIEYNSGDAGVIEAVEEFTAVDKAAVNALPQTFTTAHRAEVLRLWKKINNSFDFAEKQAMLIRLEKAKNEIDSILAEIDAIKTEIKQKLYPFAWIGLEKRKVVYNLYDRYQALSEYDRAQFEASEIEGLLKSKTQVDNLLTALIIGVCCAVVAAIATVWIVLHVRKRRRTKRASAMPESEE